MADREDYMAVLFEWGENLKAVESWYQDQVEQTRQRMQYRMQDYEGDPMDVITQFNEEIENLEATRLQKRSAVDEEFNSRLDDLRGC